MTKNILNMLKKYKIALAISLCTITAGIVGLILFFNLSKNLSVNVFKNQNYVFEYDDSWKVVSTEAFSTNLKHKGGSTLSIQVMKLQDEYRYIPIKGMLDKLLYEIEIQNEEYNLISKTEDNITKGK